jgi:hypothetical protein
MANAGGASLHLAEKVRPRQLLTIRNLLSNQEVQCEILELSPLQDGISEASVEFLHPAPRFWCISFPPTDWSPRSPEAKRITLAPVPFTQTLSSK